MKNSLKKGKLLDLSKIECVQYTNEIRDFYSKETGVINEIRNKIKQEEIDDGLTYILTVTLEYQDLKDIYKSMAGILFLTKELKTPENSTIGDVCQSITFKLNPIFKSYNHLTSLPLKNIVHLNEIVELLVS